MDGEQASHGFRVLISLVELSLDKLKLYSSLTSQAQTLHFIKEAQARIRISQAQTRVEMDRKPNNHHQLHEPEH